MINVSNLIIKIGWK